MPFSYQQNAAPLQKYAKAYDNSRSNSQYNGQFSQMNPMTPRPGGTNPGPMKMPDAAMAQPWMQDPRMMQWLMSMLGGQGGGPNTRGWF